MLCFRCDNKEPCGIFIENLPCLHCGETIVVEFNICKNCGNAWKSVGDVVITPDMGESTVIINPDSVEFLRDGVNTALDLLDEALNGDFSEIVLGGVDKSKKTTLNSLIHKCTKCNSLGMKNPELFKEWHPTKNKGKTLYDFTKGSSRLVWWRCPIGHEYDMSINDKGKKKGCPICNSRRIDKTNCLKATNPKLAKEWHPTLNVNKTPEDVFASSRTERAWWQCSKNKKHVWEARIRDRHLQNQGCPFCAGKRVLKEESLAFIRTDLKKQWHPTKNDGLKPENVTVSSGKRIWWKCSFCNYEWEANINNRNRTQGVCPKCKRK